MEELETSINIFLNKSQAESPEKEAEANQLVQAIRSEPEGFMQLIENFPSFKIDATKSFTFHVLNSIILQRWNDINPAFLEPVHHFLFQITTETSVYQALEESTASILAQTQACFVAKTFPSVIPDFLSVFESVEIIVRLRFIEALCKNLAFPVPPIIFHRSVFQELIPVFTEIIFSGVQQLFPVAFSALSYFIRWSNNEWLGTEECVQGVVAGFTIPNLKAATADVMTALLMSTGDEQAMEMITHFELLEHINEILEGEDDTAILLAYARLISAAGNATLQNTECCSTFYQYALTYFITSPDDKISGTVLSFIDTYTSLNAEVAPEVLNTVINRLAVYFESSPVRISEFCARLDHLAITALKANSESEGVINEMIDPALQENPNICAAIMNIVSDRSYTFSTFSDIFQFFAQLIQVEPPIEKALFPAVLGFYRLAFSNPQNSTDMTQEVVEEIIGTMISFIGAENESREINDNLTLLLGKFIAKFKNNFTITEEIIQAMLEINTIESSKTLALITRSVPLEGRPEVISAILQAMIANTEGEAAREGVINLFNYLSSIDCPENEELIQQIHGFLESSVETLASDEEALCLLIQSCASIGKYGFDIVYAIFEQNASNPRIVASSAKACFDIRLKLTVSISNLPADKVNDPSCIEIRSILTSEQSVQFTASLEEQFVAIIDDCWAAAPTDAEEERTMEFVAKCLCYFFGTITLLNEESREELYVMICDIMAHYYNVPLVFRETLKFARHALMVDPINAGKMFLYPSFNCLYSVSFDTNSPLWLDVLKEMINFHKLALIKIPEVFNENLDLAIAKHMGDVESKGLYCGPLTVLANRNDPAQYTAALDFLSDLSASLY